MVNVTSIAGSRVHPFAGAAYATSKAALAALTREMAADFGPLGVRVNAIAPGEIDTAILSPGTEKIVAADPAAPARHARRGRQDHLRAVHRDVVLRERRRDPHQWRPARLIDEHVFEARRPQRPATEGSMRTITAAAIVIAMLASPAYAQQNKAAGNQQEGGSTPMQQIEQDRRERMKDADRQYDKRMKAPEASTSYDPWRGVRPSVGRSSVRSFLRPALFTVTLRCERRRRRASKGDGPSLSPSFEARRCRAERLRMTVMGSARARASSLPRISNSASRFSRAQRAPRLAVILPSQVRGAERRKALNMAALCEARGIPCDRDARLTALHRGVSDPRDRASG